MNFHDTHKQQVMGRFTVADGCTLNGALVFVDEAVTLNIWDTTILDPTTMSSTITGKLEDNRIVTLFDCSLPPRAAFRWSPSHGESSIARILPNNIVYGNSTFDPIHDVLSRVTFRTQDTNVFHNDPKAFFFRRTDATSVTAHYSGKQSIFCAHTRFGTVSAFHDIQNLSIDVSERVSIRTKVYLDIEFGEALRFHDVVRRARSLGSLVGLLVGRPQNLAEMIVTRYGGKQARLNVDCRKYQTYRPAADDAREAMILGRLVDPSTDTEAFGEILTNWVARDDGWRDSRNRFDGCFGKQRRYGEDRLIGAANMFDLLPKSDVGRKREISCSVKEAVEHCKCVLKKARARPSDNDDPCNEVLRWIGRIDQKSLKQKIISRTNVILGVLEERFPDLELVIDVAVKCRNHYVHGPDGRTHIEYRDHLIFLTDTLEFVFATSDLIEDGWDVETWIARISGDHPFVRYVVGYGENLGALKEAIAQCGR